MSINYQIDGGKNLHGRWIVQGSPMAAVAAIAAGLLTEDKVTLTHVPHLQVVDRLLVELRGFGVATDWTRSHEVTLAAHNPACALIDARATSLLSWSSLLVAALLVRCGSIRFSQVSESVLPRFSLLTEWLPVFGGQIDGQGGAVVMRLSRPHGAKVEVGNNRVESLLLCLLLAVMAEGESQLNGPATHPEVVDVLTCLTAMGASIERIDEHQLVVRGNGSLRGTTYQLGPDRMEVALVAALVAASGGEVQVDEVRPAELVTLLAKLQQLGVGFRVQGNEVRVWHRDSEVLKALTVEPRPYPGFDPSWLPVWLPLLALADGVSVITSDTLLSWEPSWRLIQEVGGEGQFSQQELRLFGPTKLVPAKLDASGLDRVSTALVVASSARGRTDIVGVDEAEERFETLAERLSSIGLHVHRHEE